LRKAVQSTAKTLLTKLEKRNEPIFLIGDLQDTVSKTNRDNAGGTSHAMNMVKDGLLKLA